MRAERPDKIVRYSQQLLYRPQRLCTIDLKCLLTSRLSWKIGMRQKWGMKSKERGCGSRRWGRRYVDWAGCAVALDARWLFERATIP